jgi:cell division transport system ATP-binding protein
MAAPAEAPAEPARPLVEFRRASLIHRDGAVGLDRVSFALARGEMAFLTGPAGAGKSTAIQLLTRELVPSGGAVLVAGRDLSRLRRGGLPGYRRNLGLVRHDSRLGSNRSVRDHIGEALRVTGTPREERELRTAEILRLTGLTARADARPEDCSAGEHRRLCIARAFAGRPPLLLADDPARGLDHETSVGIMRLLYRINHTGTTVLVATRDRDLVTRLRRRRIELARGTVAADVSARPGLREESTREFAARMRGATADPELDPDEARVARSVRLARALHRDPRRRD